MKLYLAAITILLSQLPTPVHPASFIELDGNFYQADETSWHYFFDLQAVVITDTAMTNCRRTNGQPITSTLFGLYYGQAVTAIPVTPPIRFTLTPHRIAHFTTPHGDVRCNNTTAPPPEPPPAQPEPIDPKLLVFSDSFETYEL